MSSVETPALAAPRRRGVSTGLLLLVAAAFGLLGGVVLAELRMVGEPLPADDDEPEVIAMPLGEPVAVKDYMQADPETLEGISPYPGATPRKLTSRSAVNGMPMKVSWFSTQDAPDDVLAFYQRAFVADDRLVVSHAFNDNIGYVAWVDRNDQPSAEDGTSLPRGPLHMISVIGQSHQTLVLISRTEPSQFLEQPVVLPNGVVLPPSADAPQIIELSEFSLDRRTIYSLARELSLEQTKAFYERELRAGGWNIVDGAENDDRSSLTAKRGPATQVITLAPEATHTRILITLDARAAPEMSR